MPQLIEYLEVRRLFSVSAAVLADGQAIKAEDIVIKAHATSFATTVKAENAALTADLKRLHTFTADQSRLKTLKHDETDVGAIIKKDAATLSKVVTKDIMKVVSDLRKLSAHAGNADLEAELAVDTGALSGGASTNSAALLTAYTSAQGLIDADVTDIAAANGSDSAIQNHAGIERGIVAADIVTSQADATALTAGVSKFVIDAG